MDLHSIISYHPHPHRSLHKFKKKKKKKLLHCLPSVFLLQLPPPPPKKKHIRRSSWELYCLCLLTVCVFKVILLFTSPQAIFTLSSWTRWWLQLSPAICATCFSRFALAFFKTSLRCKQKRRKQVDYHCSAER